MILQDQPAGACCHGRAVEGVCLVVPHETRRRLVIPPPEPPQPRCGECFRIAGSLSEDPTTGRFVCDDCRPPREPMT